MKRISSLMLCASMALGAVSCAKDNVNNNTADNGKPTSMAIQMSFPKAGGTRATGDTNAIEAEATVKTVDVYIYNDSGDYLSHTPLTAADFTASVGTGQDVYTANATIKTTTGKKSVLVGVNLPANSAASLEGQTLAKTQTGIHTVNLQSPFDIATSGLPMFSTVVAEKTLDTDITTNVVDVQVERVVAKVTVEKDATYQQTGKTGQLGALSFAINNQNTKYYLLPTVAPHQDPNWFDSSYDETQFAAAVDPADYVAVSDQHNTDVSLYNAKYALENTSDEKKGRDLTRVTIKSSFVPATIVNSYTATSKVAAPAETANANYNTATPASSTPATFYVVTNTTTSDKVFFANEADADAYIVDFPGSPKATFTGGVCYWNIFLNKSGADPNQWDVLRNAFYQCAITQIVAPGNSTPALTSTASGTTPQNDTDIRVNVDVLNWNTPVLDKYVLEQ